MDRRVVFPMSIISLLIATVIAFDLKTGQSEGKQWFSPCIKVFYTFKQCRPTFIAIFIVLISKIVRSTQELETRLLPITTLVVPQRTNRNANASFPNKDVENKRDYSTGVQSETEQDVRANQKQIEQQKMVWDETEEVMDYEGKGKVVQAEYMDELNTVAESHEAMSKDNTREASALIELSKGTLDQSATDSKSFESRETITANSSDEDVASNEAITDEELDSKYDREVAELLKYKTEKNAYHDDNGITKTKRVPTVKKELRTQKEILINSNETQVPKKLVPEDDVVTQMNEAIRRRDVQPAVSMQFEDSQEWPPEQKDIATLNKYADVEAEDLKKLSARQDEASKDQKIYFLTDYTTEQIQQQKLRELKAQEDALAELLLKILVKLTENPSKWERMQKFLLNAQNELKLFRSLLNQTERHYESTSTLLPVISQSANDSNRLRKKLKKKKKKPKHLLFTSNVTTMSVMLSPLITTETPAQTTPVQRSLVTGRLFAAASPWQQGLSKGTQKGIATRYSESQHPKSLPSIHALIEQSKPKGNLPSFTPNKKPILPNKVNEIENHRQLRMTKIDAQQHVQNPPSEDATNIYVGSMDEKRLRNNNAPDVDHGLRYISLSPNSREFVQRQKENYPSIMDVQSNGAPRNKEFNLQLRDYSLSNNWPEFSYSPIWPWKTKQHSLLPVTSEKWPWRQYPTHTINWPQRDFRPTNKNYWFDVNNKEQIKQDVETEKIWQQQHLPESWNGDAPLTESLLWEQSKGAVPLHERDENGATWKNSKNLSQLNKLSKKPETKDKITLPQIAMKTWNSLTSDPATWPYKLPGVKPWPKDENGIAYNPNADLVKKLGLDEQNYSRVRLKEDVRKLNDEKKLKNAKHSNLFSSAKYTEEEALPQTKSSKYKPLDNRNNFDEHEKIRFTEALKSWSILPNFKSPENWMKPENVIQSDASQSWKRKYIEKNPYSSDAAMPKTHSVNPLVITADQSMWNQYQTQSMERLDEHSSNKWSNTFDRSSTNNVWPRKNTWLGKVGDSWIDQTNIPVWSSKTDMPEILPAKSNKPAFWFPKIMSDNSNSWTTKRNWCGKSKCPSKTRDRTPWLNKESTWSTKSNDSWTSDQNNNAMLKFNNGRWQVKTKEDETSDRWTPNIGRENDWVSKDAELSPLQQKMNDEWNYGKSTETWPAKWKQFAYHRVTTVPISKPGTTADAASVKPKNAFVAVSAVSSSKYTGNEWRKNEEDNRNPNGRVTELEHDANQLQLEMERPMYKWKKNAEIWDGSTKVNSSDSLENQLEALRQIDFWPYKENQTEEKMASTSAELPPMSSPTNITTMVTPMAVNEDGLLRTNRRMIPIK